MRMTSWLPLIVLAAPAAGADAPKVGARVERRGDEIVACGQLFHTTAPVVLWMDPGGYDAYRVERRFGAPDEADAKAKAKAESPGVGFALRRVPLSPERREQVRGGGWDL